MLLSCLPLVDFYHKCCALAEDPEDVREGFQHPTRLIQFLVGIKGKNEPMAIGGAWSPSLDGPDPATDPKVLIKTAIRTTRALTGVDLSACTQWLVSFPFCLMLLKTWLVDLCHLTDAYYLIGSFYFRMLLSVMFSHCIVKRFTLSLY